ncbi:diacylglycerol kinase [Porticoccaceae bacterium]|nr:diacylglycerol kinase [Porticoccaceae bacterium]
MNLIRRRTVGSLTYSLRGLRYVSVNEEAVRVELVLLLVLLPLAFWLGEGAVERVLLAGSALMVLLVEMLNTAIELALDRYSRGHHPLAGAAKDVGSAAVFIAMIIFAVTWLALLWPG